MFGAILVLSSLTEQNGELKSPPKYFCFNYLVISNVFAALLYQTIKNSRTITDEDINEIFDYLMDLSLEEK